MAHAVTVATTEFPATHTTHHGLPPFAPPMLVLFGTYAAWLLVGAIVLYFIV
jgi:hypothetical protein